METGVHESLLSDRIVQPDLHVLASDSQAR